MKKLKLSLPDFKNTEVLTRDQLKKIMGGDGSGEIDCVATGTLCYVEEDGTAYRCSIQDNQCCCGHSDYDAKCKK